MEHVLKIWKQNKGDEFLEFLIERSLVTEDIKVSAMLFLNNSKEKSNVDVTEITDLFKNLLPTLGIGDEHVEKFATFIDAMTGVSKYNG